MLRLIGSVLVIGASTALGLSARQRIIRRANVLAQLIQAIDFIAAELSERQTPLPEIIRGLTREGGVDSRCFFTEMDRRIRQEDGLSFSYRWQTTARDMAEELGLENDEIAVLRDAALYLGRYQTEQQLFGLQQTRARLEAIRVHVCDELKTKGSIYRTCGIAAGIVTVLMML